MKLRLPIIVAEKIRRTKHRQFRGVHKLLHPMKFHVGNFPMIPNNAGQPKIPTLTFQQSRDWSCIDPSVRWTLCSFRSFLLLLRTFTCAFPSSRARIGLGSITASRFAIQRRCASGSNIVPLIFFRTEIRDECEANKWAAAGFIGSLSFRANSLLSNKRTSQQRQHKNPIYVSHADVSRAHRGNHGSARSRDIRVK